MKSRLVVPPGVVFPDYVMDQLERLSSQKGVLALYAGVLPGGSHRCIVVLLDVASDSNDLYQQRWVKKVFRDYGVTVLVVSCAEGTPSTDVSLLVWSYHLDTASLLYKAEGYCPPLPDMPTCLARFEAYVQLFHHDCETYLETIRKAEKQEWFITVFQAYIDLFGRFSSCLEPLVLGRTFQEEDVHERLVRLMYYLPELGSVFVKVSPQRLYLIDILYAVYTSEQADDSNLEYELLYALSHAAEQLTKICERLFEHFTERLGQLAEVVQQDKVHPKRDEDHSCWEVVTQHPGVEAVYAYQRWEMVSTTGTTVSLRFGLVVGDSIDHRQLLEWRDITLQRTQGRIELVPIVHSRIWIQRNLYAFQAFFLRVMQPDFLVYEHNAYLPQPHWIVPYDESFFEVSFYQKHLFKLYASYQHLCTMDDTSHAEGRGLLYSSLLLRGCRLLVYTKWTYYPNALPVALLWRLCQMADERVMRLDYLLSKLGFDFLSFVTHHQNLYRAGQPIRPEEWEVLDEILGVVVGFGGRG